jgi:hypothetical protein
VIDKIRLQILHDHIQTLLLNLHQQDSALFEKVKGDAEYLARELFPAAAKALVFEKTTPDGKGRSYTLAVISDRLAYEVAPTSEGFYGLSHKVYWRKHCNTEAEAIAACEQHHQQTFKDQIA